jgi:hypothetical protein
MGVIGGLAAAVDLATAGDTLHVRGTCKGLTTIDKRITIVGKPSDTLGPPTLDGNGADRVVVNIASGQSAAIRLTASLTMRDKAVVRDNVDQGGFAAIATDAQPDWPVTFTMRDDSRVTSHLLAPGGSAVAKFVGCGKTTYIGVKARVVGNAPKNIRTYQVLS